VKQCDADGIFVRHLLCQMIGVKNIRDSAFVCLTVVGGIGDLHGFVCERRIDHPKTS
jgi:hypothetical protein